MVWEESKQGISMERYEAKGRKGKANVRRKDMMRERKARDELLMRYVVREE